MLDRAGTSVRPAKVTFTGSQSDETTCHDLHTCEADGDVFDPWEGSHHSFHSPVTAEVRLSHSFFAL